MPDFTPSFSRRQMLQGGGALALAGWSWTAAAAQDAVPPGGIEAALSNAGPGTVLTLAPGDHGPLHLRGLRGTARQPVVIRSAQPGATARISQLAMKDCAHVRLEGLELDYAHRIAELGKQQPLTIDTCRGVTLDGLVLRYSFRPGEHWDVRPFRVERCEAVSVIRTRFIGDVARGTGPEYDGYGWAFGLFIQSCSDVAVQGCDVTGFARGLIFRMVEGLTVTGNNVHGVRMDGMTFAQVSDTLIEGNHIHAFARAVDSRDHADMIQFWTASTNAPSHDVTIRRNLLNSENGAFTQTIFMRNDVVDRGLAGTEMFYRNLVIEENVIINAHPHGITVGETRGLDIRNNTLIRNRRSAATKHRPDFYIPQIRVSEMAEDVRILRNVAPRVPGARRLGNWEVRDNYMIQDDRLSAPNHYDKVFAAARTGDPADLDSFRYKAGGPLDGAGLGASWLAPQG